MKANYNKLFIKDITTHASDTFMEALMTECGPIVKFKRTKMNNKLANFGYVEFEDIKGVFTCLRCVHDLQLLDKKLVIRAKDEVADYHEKWK
jgi:RNA recognition motif-containing protein